MATYKRPDTVRPQPPLMLFPWQHNLQVTSWLLSAGWTPARIAETFPDVVRLSGKVTHPLDYTPATRETCMLIPRDAIAAMDADDRATWTENEIYSGWLMPEN